MEEPHANPYARLKELLALKRARRLTFEEICELVALHQRAAADLSLLTEADAAGQAALRALVSESFNEVYSSLSFYRRPPLEFLRVFYLRTPEVLHKYRLYCGLAVLAMAVAALAGVSAVLSGDEVSPRLVLSSQLVEYFQDAVGRDQDWALAAGIPPAMRPPASVAIMLNNLQIALVSFLLGILLGYFTLAVVMYNGYMLGYVAAMYLHSAAISGRPELGWYFTAGVGPHGVLEIPAILLAATAGLALGLSWVFPGRRLRSQAFAETARETLLLVSAAALLLVVAGLIEGFITPLGDALVADREFSTFTERFPIYLGKVALSALLLFWLIEWLRRGWQQTGRGDARKPQKQVE